MGGKDAGVTGVVACCLDLLNSQNLVLLILVVLGGGLIRSTGLVRWSSISSAISSKFKNVNAASRLESETTAGLRGGKGAEDFGFGAGPPKSKIGRKDSGAGAEMGCGRAVRVYVSPKERRDGGNTDIVWT
jgi:hypothetical protein